jgi:hypothetical protein
MAKKLLKEFQFNQVSRSKTVLKNSTKSSTEITSHFGRFSMISIKRREA